MTLAKILIVEDQRVVARDIANHLAHLGYSVLASATSAEEAVRLTERLSPDLVLMDIRLEGAMDGVEAAVQIRECCQVPVIFVTAYADPETMRRARVAEPFSYVIKPFREVELQAAIEMALYKHQAERRLRDSERRHAVTLSSIGDAVIATDDQLRVTFMNPVAESLTGWSRADASGRPVGDVFRIVNEFTRQPVEDPAAKVLREGTRVGLANHTVLLPRDGGEVPIDDSGAPIVDGRGQIVGVVLVFHDVTEQRRAQEALTLFRSLLDHTNDMIEIVDPETGRFLDVNETACRAHGYTREEYLSLTVSDVAPPIGGRAWEDLTQEERSSHFRPFEAEHRRKDGSVFSVEVSASYVHLDRKYVLAVVRDITERKLEEERWRLTFDAARVGTGVWDIKADKITFSDSLQMIAGYAPGTYHPNFAGWLERIHPDDLEYVQGVVRDSIAEKKDISAAYRLVQPSGKVVWVDSRAKPFYDEAGNPSHMVGVLIDITDAKLTEDALRESEARLRESEERYRLLFERSPQPMWVYDRETLRLLAVNEAAVRHYGYSREEFLAMTIKDIRPAEDVPKLLEDVAQAGDELQSPTLWRHRKKDGTLIDVEVVANNFEFAGRRTQLILAVDVTERQRLEVQLRQAQKMEAVGRLAGGIAHDFNNLLTAIIGYGRLALRRLAEDHPARSYLDEIVTAGERAATLTSQLLAFSRKQILQLRVMDLNDCVASMESLLTRLIGEDIDLKTFLTPDLGRVKADPGQVEQVVLNLVLNARDAMPQGGKITVETHNVHLDQEYARRHAGVVPGPHVLLAVSDTGVGMDEATKRQIFEPFFTTKGQGKGTGLGLATVYGIVKQLGGSIWVYSEPGRGTTFKIYLPRESGEVEERASEPEVPRDAGGTETVFVVEDEPGVRHLAREVLEARGYRVLEAASGEAALVLCEQTAEPIDLLLTDVVMPGMGGRELADRFLALRPQARVLFMSGYTDDAMIHRGVLVEGTDFIQKPFSPDALAHKIRLVLDRHDPGPTSADH